MSSGKLASGIALLVLLGIRPAHGGLVTYDASLGALPQATGWTYFDQAPGVAQPAVINGELQSGDTGDADLRYWLHDSETFSFDPGFVLETTLKVVQSDYLDDAGDGTQRSGFYLEAVDVQGRRLTLGIASTGVTVNTDATLTPQNGIPLVPFNTTDGFHRFQVSVEGDSAVLRIDDVRQGAAPLGGSVLVASRVYFGDGSFVVGSSVVIRSVLFGVPAVSAVGAAGPAPEDELRITVRRLGAGGGIDFDVGGGRGGNVRLQVLDLAGRRVADLGEARVLGPGASFHWTGRDANGHAAGSGVYFIVARGSAGRASARVPVIR